MIKRYPKFNKENGVEEYLKEPLIFTNNPPEKSEQKNVGEQPANSQKNENSKPQQPTIKEEEEKEVRHQMEEEPPAYSEEIVVK
jgi:hypothetical protein